MSLEGCDISVRIIGQMTDALSPLLTALRSKPLDTQLDQMEPHVWKRIGRDQSQSQSGVWSWRAGVAAAMLAFGVFAGGAAAAKAAVDPSPFALHSAYAPSTLLESGE